MPGASETALISYQEALHHLKQSHLIEIYGVCYLFFTFNRNIDNNFYGRSKSEINVNF